MQQRSQVRYAPDILEVENSANLIPLLNEKIASPPPNVWLKGLIGLFAKPSPLGWPFVPWTSWLPPWASVLALVLKSSVIGPEASDSYIAPIISYVVSLIANSLFKGRLSSL